MFKPPPALSWTRPGTRGGIGSLKLSSITASGIRAWNADVKDEVYPAQLDESDLTPGPPAPQVYSRFSNLVQLESEPLFTMLFPQWMVELYREICDIGASARRLFLPENSVKSKLPYYKEAVSDPDSWVKLDPQFEHLTHQYRKYGRNGVFTCKSEIDRSRGRRFDMPSPGMKSIVATEIFLTIFLSTIYV